MTRAVIALAGAGGDLGFRIARALAQKGLDYGAVLAELVNPETRTKTFVYEPQAVG